MIIVNIADFIFLKDFIIADPRLGDMHSHFDLLHYYNLTNLHMYKIILLLNNF